MNSKIFKYLKLKSELSADDLKQAESLAAMTEDDKRALIEFLGGKSKVTKLVTKRVIAYCAREGCDMTKRAVIHKDETDPNYHEFQSSKPKRSSGLSNEARQRLSRKVLGVDGGVRPLLCAYEIDGKVCHGTENDGIHDQSMGYAAYHEFQAETAVGVGG